MVAMLRPFALACTLTCAALGAQGTQVVDPPPFDMLPATQQTGFPFGYPNRNVVRVLEIHDGLQGAPRTITGIALRRSAASTATVPAFTATVTLKMSTSPRTAATIGAAFQDNRGQDEMTLLNQVVLSFPATSQGAGGVEPFDFVIQGPVPFQYGSAGPLAVELVVHSHDSTVPFKFDLFRAERPASGPWGDGCAGLALQGTLDYVSFTATASGLPPGAPVLFGAGFDMKTVQGIPLPWDLTALGATGCSLYVAPLLSELALADPAGTFSRVIDTTGLPPGLWFAAQVAAIHPSLNPAALALTAAQVVAPAPARVAARVWSEDLTAASGTAQPIHAWVLALR